MFYDQVLLFEQHLWFFNGYRNLKFLPKFFGPFWTLFWSKNWPFLPKNNVFGHFLQNRSSDFHVTWSETGENGFKSFIGSILSGKILVLAILVIFGQ